MGDGSEIADERDRWCAQNGLLWTCLPHELDRGDDDRLIMLIRAVRPRVVGPSKTSLGWVSIAGLEAVCRLGRFDLNVVAVDANEALAISDALQLGVAEMERIDMHSADYMSNHSGGVLDMSEIRALLDGRWKPRWVQGLSLRAQRLWALIDAAVDGRYWAVEYVFPDGSVSQDVVDPVVDFHCDGWAVAIGGTAEQALEAGQEISLAYLSVPGVRRWWLNT